MSNGAIPTLIGRTIASRYVVEREVGMGAMGTVYGARQLELGTPVAIKVLHPRFATDPGLVQRFEREAFAASRLDHPNTLRVIDFGKEGDVLYLVTEYVDAANLLSIMESEWPLSDERIVSILSQVLDALTAVHEIGIVHRDIKPENVLVLVDTNDDGEKVDVVKLCDFGIAKVARRTLLASRSFAPRLTQQGVVMGTPDYMSPEQARGQAVDGRSDLYSVGVVLYHLLTGRTPFDADSPVGIALQHVSETPAPPSHYGHVHPGLEAVCLRAMSKRMDERFASALEMRKALRNVLASDSTALAPVLHPETSLTIRPTSTSNAAMLSLAGPTTRPGFGGTSRERIRLVLSYAAVASVAAIAGSAFMSSTGSTATDPLERAYHFPAVGELASQGAAAAAVPLFAMDTIAEADSTHPVAEAPPEPPKMIEAPRPLPPPGPSRTAPKPQARRAVVAATPAATPIPAVEAPAPASAPVLVRNDPWPSQPRAPEPAGAIPPNSRESRASTDASNRVDSTLASVNLSSVVTSAGISTTKVKTGLSHVPFLACYQRALQLRPSAAPIDAELRLSIDVGGRVVGAVLVTDGGLPGLRECVVAAVRGARIRDVDTGDGSATIQLRFAPR
jgi:eukaryotic-like serine/threonine-protein kinase